MKKQILFTCIGIVSLLVSLETNAQSKEEVKETIFYYVDVKPEFVGGRDSLIAFLKRNMQFPEKASKKGIKKGKVYVEFVVKTDGAITDIKAIKSDENVFEKEAVRLVEIMPAWKPGTLKEKAVNTRYTLPIKFGQSCPLETK